MKQTSIGKDDWPFGKTDNASAYKHLEIMVSDMRCAYVAIRHQVAARWYAIRPKTLLFGSSADVMHYNTIIGLFSAIAARILCNQAISYFDDFGFPTKPILGGPPLRAANCAARLLGILLEGRKSATDKEIAHSGILGVFHSAKHGRQLVISFASDRISKIVGILTASFGSRSPSRASLERLVAKLNCPPTALYSRFRRAPLHPLYRKLVIPALSIFTPDN